MEQKCGECPAWSSSSRILSMNFLRLKEWKSGRGVQIFTPFMTTVGQPWDLGSLPGRALLTARPLVITIFQFLMHSGGFSKYEDFIKWILDHSPKEISSLFFPSFSVMFCRRWRWGHLCLFNREFLRLKNIILNSWTASRFLLRWDPCCAAYPATLPPLSRGELGHGGLYKLSAHP